MADAPAMEYTEKFGQIGLTRQAPQPHAPTGHQRGGALPALMEEFDKHPWAPCCPATGRWWWPDLYEAFDTLERLEQRPLPDRPGLPAGGEPR